MAPDQLLDPIPIVGVFALIVVILLVAFEIGFRFGRWYQDRTPDEKEGPTGMLVGSLLALMAFLLAITMGMASDRFDNRRQLVLNEANAIGTTFLRAGYLPAPYAADSRALLREYVPLRITETDQTTLRANFTRSLEIQDELWSKAEELARATPDSVVLGLYIDSLNQTIDISEARVTAIVNARVPQTVLVLLLAGMVLTMGAVGYSAGLTRHRGVLTAVVLVVALAAVLTLVVDLDRGSEGFLQVSQQPLRDLQQQLAAF
jgi:hypothetical protein